MTTNLNQEPPDFNEALIDLVRASPCLYNSRHVHYNDKTWKESIWKNISENLAQFDQPDEEFCKKRWKQLRDQFGSAGKNINKAKVGGSAAGYVPHFAHYEATFLIDYMRQRRTTGNVPPASISAASNDETPENQPHQGTVEPSHENESQEDPEDATKDTESQETEAEQQPLSSDSSEPRKKRRRSDRPDFQATISNVLQQNAQSINDVTTAIASRNQPANEFTAFGNLVATSLSKLPSIVVYDVMTSILQLIGSHVHALQEPVQTPSSGQL